MGFIKYFFIGIGRGVKITFGKFIKNNYYNLLLRWSNYMGVIVKKKKNLNYKKNKQKKNLNMESIFQRTL